MMIPYTTTIVIVERVSMSVKPQFQISLIIVAMVIAALLSYGILKMNVPPPENMTTAKAGQSQPEVVFFDRTDAPMALADFKGEVLLVNLWATWCTPCVAELPTLDRLQGKLKDKKFRVLAISMDRSSVPDILGFLKDKKIEQLDFFWDKEREIASKWKYTGIPVSFLIDRSGNIVETYNGEQVWDKGPLFNKVVALVDGK